MTEKQKEKLLELYNNYVLGEELRKEEFSKEELEKEKVLGLMYTTLEDDAYGIQVSYDLENHDIITTLTHYESGKEWSFTEPEAIEEFLDELGYLDFNDWFAYAHRIVEDNFVVDLSDDAW